MFNEFGHNSGPCNAFVFSHRQRPVTALQDFTGSWHCAKGYARVLSFVNGRFVGRLYASMAAMRSDKKGVGGEAHEWDDRGNSLHSAEQNLIERIYGAGVVV